MEAAEDCWEEEREKMIQDKTIGSLSRELLI